MKKGRVIWITGLSGSGKTTLAECLYQHLQDSGQHPVLLDGDELRKIYDLNPSYDFNERANVGMRHAKLCQLIARQGVTVICSTISLVHEIHQWNRENNDNYIEVLLRCKDEIRKERLLQRKDSHIYESAEMVGNGVEAQWPLCPDMVLENNQNDGIEAVCLKLTEHLRKLENE